MKLSTVALTVPLFFAAGTITLATLQHQFSESRAHVFSQDEVIPDDDEETCWVAPEWRDDSLEDCWVAPEWRD